MAIAPSFKLVTGVSTGALISPFAFLGPEYDAGLTEVYTDINQSNIFEKRFITAAVTEDALSDTAPLYATISKHVDERMMARIAEEYERGRLLLIQTTDLDAGYPVIWNIGAIAKSGGPEALSLIRHIMLASASIPAAFPPVMFDVEAKGEPYQEMHVDGGAVSQAFLVPPSVDPHIAQKAAGFHARKMVAYIIRNSRLTTEWTDVERQTLSIAQRAVTTMINYNGVGDFYRMYMDNPPRQRLFQPRLYRQRLPRRAQGGVRYGLHAGALSLRLRQGRQGLSLARRPSRVHAFGALAKLGEHRRPDIRDSSRSGGVPRPSPRSRR